MKRGLGLLSLISGLFLLKFTSAQFFDNYNSFSITNFFNTISPQDMTFLALFIIFFALIFLILTRLSLFRDQYGNPNKAIAGVISLAVSLLSTYYLYISGFNLQGIFSGFGISSDLFYPFFGIILVIAAIFIIMYMGFRGFFIISGILLLLVGFFTNLVYESGIVIVIGGVLLLLGLWMGRGSRNAMMRGGQVIGGQIRKDYPAASKGWLWILLGGLVLAVGFALSNGIVMIVGFILAIIALWIKFSKPKPPAGEQFPGQMDYRPI